jgi:hypothetical protein
MSRLTTQEMMSIAQDTKKAKAALAFRVSGMTTVLTERDRKTSHIDVKVHLKRKLDIKL